MSNNRTFFKKAQQGEMSYQDIFSQVFRKHTSEETARVFIAGTSLTTPSEAEMLAGWQKPFLFARFFVVTVLVAALGYFMGVQFGHYGGMLVSFVALAVLAPVTLLLLTWEMNVPRNISLYEILGIFAVGGILSLIATMFLGQFRLATGSQWAPLTEEPAKLLIICLCLMKKDRRYILNGMLLGLAVGAGFSAMENLFYIFKAVLQTGEWVNGIAAGIARTVTGIDGHEIWAALYGGALVMVKGRDKLNFSHFLKPQFLMYFAAAFALHYVHNSDLGLSPLVQYGALSAISLFLFLRLLKTGVNEIVAITAGLNGGRVTQAVERDAKMGIDSTPASVFQLEFLTGPYAGKRIRLASGRSLTLGRVQGRCDVALPQCGGVSSRHCSITCTETAVTVTDLGSTNGTTVDGQMAPAQTAVTAKAGSVIILGKGECSIRVVG